MVVVSCPRLMRQIFEHPASAGRFPQEPALLVTGGLYGILSTNGKVWSEQRKFSIRTLRQFGMGKRNEIESSILTEADHAIISIRKEAALKQGLIESPIDILKTLTSNTLWKMVRGGGISVDDVNLKRMTGDLIHAFNESFKKGLPLFPWLKHVAPKWSGYTDLVNCSKVIQDFIRQQFQEHKRQRDDGDVKEPRDMMDVYIDQMEKCSKNGHTDSTFYGEIGWKHSVAVMTEMFAAGGESTPTTLNWLILHLTHDQRVQRKLQQEIDEVLGTQEPSLMDKSRMPYTEAVILEVLRRSPVFPLIMAHEFMEDIDSLCGFKLPRGALLMPNIYQAHMNKQFWGDPEAFRPERFLSDDDDNSERVSERKASVVALNVGKRSCPGEPLAMDVLFLFVVKLFQAFQIKPFPENAKPDFESSDAFLIMAKPFSIVVKERQRV